jgi:hypothetical protein
MSYSETLTADIRLVILRELADSHDYRCNESVLQSVLDKYGHACSRDKIRVELRWLESVGAVTIQDVGVLVATATARGVDTAQGRYRIDGVKRPGPRD